MPWAFVIVEDAFFFAFGGGIIKHLFILLVQLDIKVRLKVKCLRLFGYAIVLGKQAGGSGQQGYQ